MNILIGAGFSLGVFILIILTSVAIYVLAIITLAGGKGRRGRRWRLVRE